MPATQKSLTTQGSGLRPCIEIIASKRIGWRTYRRRSAPEPPEVVAPEVIDPVELIEFY